MDGLFDQIRWALAAERRVEVGFDPLLGYPTVVAIEAADGLPEIDLVARQFTPIVQPVGCPSEPGTATDLTAEPLQSLVDNGYIRWVDSAGCPVRVDVIADFMGSEHCGWEESEWIIIGTPLGAPITDEGATPVGSARTYIWDPESAISPHAAHISIPVEDLPPSAEDTGFRAGDVQLWLDPADPEHLYRVRHPSADRFVFVADPVRCA